MTKKLKSKGRLISNPVFGALTQLPQQLSRFRHFLAFKIWLLIMSVHTNGKGTCCSLKHRSILEQDERTEFCRNHPGSSDFGSYHTVWLGSHESAPLVTLLSSIRRIKLSGGREFFQGWRHWLPTYIYPPHPYPPLCFASISHLKSWLCVYE